MPSKHEETYAQRNYLPKDLPVGRGRAGTWTQRVYLRSLWSWLPHCSISSRMSWVLTVTTQALSITLSFNHSPQTSILVLGLEMSPGWTTDFSWAHQIIVPRNLDWDAWPCTLWGPFLDHHDGSFNGVERDIAYFLGKENKADETDMKVMMMRERETN